MTKEEIGATLKQLRINSGKTQSQIAKLIGRTQQIVGHWETGYSQPDANTLFVLCDIYGVSVDMAFGFNRENVGYSCAEKHLISNLRKLNDEGQDKLIDYSDDLVSSGRYIKNYQSSMGEEKQA